MDNLDNVAQTGANLEMYFSDFSEKKTERSVDGYVVLDVFTYTRGESETYPNREYPKAIAVRDEATGDIYVHFNGTGDGNWNYNSAAYGGPPSRMQEEALTWFNSFIEKKYEGKSGGNLYVTGHSQGGNNAQFVTIRSPYADYITNCVPLDAPGFSEEFVTDSIKLYGEAFYERQRDKIWAYNGECDYVSCLGQISIVPDGYTSYLKYTDPNHTETMDFMNYHAADGLLDRKGNIKTVGDDSAFRKYVVKALEKVKQLPPERQKRAADLMMTLLEDMMGDGKNNSNMHADLSSDEFAELKQMLAPLLVEILADSPDSIVPVLQQFGMERATAEAIADLIEHFNTYSPEIREVILKEILQAVKFEDYRFDIDWSEVPDAVLTAWPVIVETMRTNPGNIEALLNELGVDAVIGNWIQEHPWTFIGICILAVLSSPLWTTLVDCAVTIGILADVLIRIVQGIEQLANHIKDGIVTMLTLLKNAINAISEWVRSTFNAAGVRYADSNPYLKVDTAKLREYALRINAVNNRLRSLDSGLRGLYWQVGMLDIWDILCANLLTGESPTLNRVSIYLNNSADRFDAAENKAYGYIGG